MVVSGGEAKGLGYPQCCTRFRHWPRPFGRSLLRNTKFGEPSNLDSRADFLFDRFGLVNFNNPGSNVSSPTMFGMIAIAGSRVLFNWRSNICTNRMKCGDADV